MTVLVARDDQITAEAISSMRVGYTAAMYAVPDEVPEEGRGEWQLRRAAELGCTALQLPPRDVPSDAGHRDALGELAAELDIELEGNAPLFTPLGTDPAKNGPELQERLEAAKGLGMTVVRAGYGRLNLETSRYAKGKDAARAQLEHITNCLGFAAKVAAGVGLYVAIENHCDFTGREVAGVLADVGSEWVGAAVDTANGFTVFCDPNDDVEALAPFAFTTHMKDMHMEASPMRGLIPLVPRGCRLGEGHVDQRRAVQLFAQRSPHANGLHLIVEAGWETFDPAGPGAIELKRSLLEDGVRYLNELVADLGGKR